MTGCEVGCCHATVRTELVVRVSFRTGWLGGVGPAPKSPPGRPCMSTVANALRCVTPRRPLGATPSSRLLVPFVSRTAADHADDENRPPPNFGIATTRALKPLTGSFASCRAPATPARRRSAPFVSAHRNADEAKRGGREGCALLRRRGAGEETFEPCLALRRLAPRFGDRRDDGEAELSPKCASLRNLLRGHLPCAEEHRVDAALPHAHQHARVE